MQSNITKIIAAIMALVMVICCFSACNKDKGDEESSTVPEVELPTNPEDVIVNDGSDVDPNAPEKAPNIQTGNNNGSSNNGGSNNGGSYPSYPSYPSNPTNPSTPSGGSQSMLDPEYWETEIEHFFTHFDTPEERKAVLALAGYEYDAEQDIYYTHLNPWQRQFGFADIYDKAAPVTNMYYLTLKIDFRYKGEEDLLWRLQWWKGQYGILEGAELGVYTKKPHNTSQPFYKCAEDSNLLKMHFDYYHSLESFKASDILFTRYEQEHWWLTGFKFGAVNPKKNVVRATIYAKDDAMADGIEEGLKNVTDANGNPNGFAPYQEGVTETDYYIRNGNKFTVVWYQAGYLNYGGTPENPSAPNPDVNIPEESETV